MDEGAFDQNFTWFEWGFVDPSDMPAEEQRTYVEANAFSAGYRLTEKRDEDRRWQT